MTPMDVTSKTLELKFKNKIREGAVEIKVGSDNMFTIRAKQLKQMKGGMLPVREGKAMDRGKGNRCNVRMVTKAFQGETDRACTRDHQSCNSNVLG